MCTIIQFPMERRIEQMLHDINFDDIDYSSLEIHLDVLNDIVLDETNEVDAQQSINLYCNTCEIDPAGYKLHWTPGEVVVTIAE